MTTVLELHYIKKTQHSSQLQALLTIFKFPSSDPHHSSQPPPTTNPISHPPNISYRNSNPFPPLPQLPQLHPHQLLHPNQKDRLQQLPPYLKLIHQLQ